MEQQNYTDKPTLAAWNELAQAAESIPQIVTGTYAGNNMDTRTITLGFQPKALLIFRANGCTSNEKGAWGGLALPGYPVTTDAGNSIEITSTGFLLRYSNDSGYVPRANGPATFYYIALR